MSDSNNPSVLKTIDYLIQHGWIPLRRMSALLGLKHPTAIYQRQRGKHRIQTITVGGIHRVYKDDVIKTLENEPAQKQSEAQYILRLISTKERLIKDDPKDTELEDHEGE